MHPSEHIPKINFAPIKQLFAFALFLVLSSFCHAYYPCMCPEIIEEASNWDDKFLKKRFPIPSGDFEKLIIPIRRANNLLLIEAEVDGQKGNFILDLGAPYLVLNETYFRDYEKVEGLIAGTMTDVTTSVNRTRVERLSVRSLFYTDIEADVLDLSHVENKRGVKILGLLGLSLFREVEMEFDLAQNRLIIYELNDDGNRLNKAEDNGRLLLSTAIQLRNNIILIDAEIGGKKLKFCFDTAAEINVIDQNVPNKVLENLEITDRMLLRGASSNQVEVFSGIINDMRIEETTLEPMRIILTDMNAMRAGFGIPVDGMLGYEFIAMGRLRINFRKKELLLFSNE